MPGSICFVAHDFAGIVRNGGIGTYYWLMARLLARHGWKVHVLYCGPPESPEAMAATPGRLERDGISFLNLHDLQIPSQHQLTQYGGQPWAIDLGATVIPALEHLHETSGLDLIEFADWRAVGFRPVQARQLGVALQESKIVVQLHAPSEWERDGNKRWPRGMSDLKLDWCERYAYENADIQLAPTNFIAAWARERGWKIREDLMVSYPHPPAERGIANNRSLTELVFFGRLEPRKGLQTFIDAVRMSERQMAVTFLGRDTELRPGLWASQHVESELEGWELALELDRDRDSALDFLVEGGRLAVIASESETFGFTVAECIAHEIPFVACKTGGIPEVFCDHEAQAMWLCDPNPGSLADAIARAVSVDESEEGRIRTSVRESCSPKETDPAVVAAYEKALEIGESSQSGRRRRLSGGDWRPLVTVGVTHYNLGSYLGSALRSLEQQTWDSLEILVMDDGSTARDSIEAFEALEARHETFTFLRQPNAGPGGARNALLARARGEVFIPMDADNIARPNMVEQFVRSLELRPDLAALACFFLAFESDEDLGAGRFVYQYAPTGGPLVVACIENVFGDTNAAFRTNALRRAGGFVVDRRTPWEDWETFVRLALSGHRLDVLPESLFYYRLREDSRSQLLTVGWTDTFRMEQHLLKEILLPAPLEDAETQRNLWVSAISLGILERQDDAERQQRQAELMALSDYAVDLRTQLEDSQSRIPALEMELSSHEADLIELAARREAIRYAAADRVAMLLRRIPGLKWLIQRFVRR